ncbi:sensor histidine kinase [Devosia sp. SL43]|uniref:sensor histidine kinase n=1 Tax=Devosia sp. SL43 TaxID=2806348 RepID=UPI001F1ED772|nr:PAS domain-containing sensor histidine kinase [Devosia sp. SL43]UJW85541.1 PAS-domain containing protein [Devosia sp. SL43]
MRSAEKSGVGADGFGAGKGRAAGRSFNDLNKQAPRRPLRLLLSPITTAVALTSLLSATLFVIYDTARTLEDARHELAIIGAAIASEIAELAPDAATAAIGNTPHRYATVTRASLVGSPDAQLPLLGQIVPAAPHGALALEAEPTGTLMGLGQRGVVAFALAGLLTLLTWRRRKGDMPDMVQRHSYRTLAAAIPMGVACWTKAGALVVCNQQYRDRLNLTSMSVTYHDAVKRLIQGGYMKLINEDESNRLLELHRQDGSCLLIDERPLDDGGFMTLVSDVTERKKTDTLLHSIREEQRLLARRYHEEKLKAEAASYAKTNFLAHLSHDIRTPLNHIIGFAELMRHQTYGPLGDARYVEYVQSIKTSGEHLLASFATILDLAELESGQKPMRSDPVPVDEVLETVVQRFRKQAARAGLTFVLDEPSEAVVQGDRLGLVRMVANIVENSLRFTPSGGRVTLAAFAARDGVVIEVTDTGVGMSEDRLASLSQPFALGDATFTREGIGPGLGISISRAIAELSGGRMAIDSSPSLGTTVAISLPLHSNDVLVAAE